MTKSEVKNALDEITEMSDKEIGYNSNYIRKVAEEAYALIKNLERRRAGMKKGCDYHKNLKRRKEGEQDDKG